MARSSILIVNKNLVDTGIECDNSAVLRHAQDTVLAFVTNFTDGVNSPASSAEHVTAGQGERVGSSVIEADGAEKGFGERWLLKLLGGFTGASGAFGAILCWI